MYFVNDRKLSTHLDSSQTSAAKSLAKWSKVSICVTLVAVSVCSVLAVEIEFLRSGTLVVVMLE